MESKFLFEDSKKFDRWLALTAVVFSSSSSPENRVTQIVASALPPHFQNSFFQILSHENSALLLEVCRGEEMGLSPGDALDCVHCV